MINFALRLCSLAETGATARMCPEAVSSSGAKQLRKKGPKTNNQSFAGITYRY